MSEIANNNQIIQLLTLSDEINQVNLKVKQLIEELHSTSEHLGNLKTLTDVLTNKAGAINNEVMGYTPSQTPENEPNGVPSWQSEGSERQRIVPTPENQMQYVDVPPEVVAVPDPVVAPMRDMVETVPSGIDHNEVVEPERNSSRENNLKKRTTSRNKTRSSTKKSSAKKSGFFSQRKDG